MKRLYLCLAIVIGLLACIEAKSKTIESYIEVTAGGYVYYEEKGYGEPLIFLHGHSLDTRMWSKQIEYFSRFYRTISLDFRGYGRSSQQIENFQFCHVDDLITLMDSLKIDKAHIVGLSMGAFIAGDMLAMHPDRLMTCTLASGSIRGCDGPSLPMDAEENAKRDTEIEKIKLTGIDSMKANWIDALVKGGRKHGEKTRKALTRMINDWQAWQPMHKEARLFYANDAWEELKRSQTKIPVLMLRGEYENKNGKARERQHLSNFTIKIMPECGHMMNMQQPQTFNATVHNFIKNNEAKK